MFDLRLRIIKDDIFDPASRLVPNFVHPLAITAVGFFCGGICCTSSLYGHSGMALTFWCLNRALDCLDGSVARQRGKASDLGGFLDLLADFIIYSLIPICSASSLVAQQSDSGGLWLSVAILEASFHINNFILFYVAAVTEKRKAALDPAERKQNNTGTMSAASTRAANESRKELTSLSMRPSLIEGAESAMFFTVMLVKPAWLEILCQWMAALVGIGILDRTFFLIKAL